MGAAGTDPMAWELLERMPAPAIATRCGSSCLGLVLLGVSVPSMAPCPRAHAQAPRSQLYHGIAGTWDLALLPVRSGSCRFGD